MTVRIDISTKGALLSGKGPAVIQAGLDSFVTEAVAFLDGQVKARTPQGVSGAQAGLMGSIQNDVAGKGTPLVKGAVMTAHPYSEVIEKGRRPGKGMPRGALLRWIQVKLGISDPKELARANFLIQRKIKAVGFGGRHMFEKAVTENQAVLDAMALRHGLTITTELDA